MIVFYIVRHGQTLLNSLDRAQGWADSPLTDIGIKTAIDLGKKLKEIDFDIAYTSDMSRTVQTAELILTTSGNTHVSIQKDTRLREWCLGNMEAEKNITLMKNVSDWLGGIPSFWELNKRLPDVATAIFNNDTTGMAESFDQITSRLKEILFDICNYFQKKKCSNILIVTHAFAIKTLIYLFAPEKLSKIEKVKNAEISKLVFDNNKFILENTYS